MLGGSGTPGTGASSIVGYQWTILAQPSDGVAALDDDELQAPTLSPLPTRGTVLCFLVVEDDDGNFSEQDPSQAPDSAFVHVSIKTRFLGVEIPAAAQRNWHDEYERLVDALETFRVAFAGHNIVDHDTDATGAQLNDLTAGATVTPGTLHAHEGDDYVTLAAFGVAGKIELATGPADSGHPKAVTKIYFPMSLMTTTAAAKLVPNSSEMFVFIVPQLGVLAALDIVAMDGWDGVFSVHLCSEANYLAGAFGTAIATVTLTDDAARTTASMVPSGGQAVGLKQYIVVVKGVPTGTPGSPTKHLVCHLNISRQY